MSDYLCKKNGRRYFIINFDGNCHNHWVNIIKLIPSVKIRCSRHHAIGKNNMLVGCNGQYCEALLYEIRKAKEIDGYCTCFELGCVSPKDIFKREQNYDYMTHNEYYKMITNRDKENEK